MQVQSSYTATFYSNTKGINAETTPTVAEARQPHAELEEMLGHLRADPIIGSRISENDDGTYSFDMTAGGWNDKAFAASAIVTELNGGRFDNTRGTSHAVPSASDAQLFKQITHYSLLTLGGQTLVLDRNGYPPSHNDQGLVQQGLELVQDIARSRASGILAGELTIDNVASFLSSEYVSQTSRDLTGRLFNVLREETAGVTQVPEAPPAPQSSDIAALMTMVSV